MEIPTSAVFSRTLFNKIKVVNLCHCGQNQRDSDDRGITRALARCETWKSKTFS